MSVHTDVRSASTATGVERRSEAESAANRQVHDDPAWRVFVDRVLAVLILIAIAPLMLAVAIVIKLESPRSSVFYRQIRVGRNRRRRALSVSTELPHGERRKEDGAGEPFEIWKFRSMVPDAEAKTGPVWATVNDPRITPLGRLLRKSRIDELPQLFNIIRGEMRLIGPRPERPHFVAKLTEKFPDYPRRLLVAPGLTGLSQVELEYDSDLDDVRTKLRYDLFYIDRRCAILDLKILLKTAAVVIRRRGAH